MEISTLSKATTCELKKPRRSSLKIGQGRWLIYLILIVGLSFTLLPFLMMILSSFKTNLELLRIPSTFWPEKFTLQNYIKIFNDPNLPLMHFYGNSAFVAFFNVISTLFTSSLIGYMFAKFEFPGKKILFGLFLTMMMIPMQITMIPSYLILAKIGLINSLWSLIIFSAVDPFGIFLMRQFCETIPNELMDAARVDGASEWRIYGKIVLPQLGAPLATLGILSFMFSWNSYLWPMIVLQKVEVRTLPVILTWFSTSHAGQAGLIMAATVLIVIPVLIVFMYFQKWIVQGFTMTGLK